MIRFITLTLFTLLCCATWLTASETFRIVGYLPTYRFKTIENIEVEKLTHLLLAFGQVDGNGEIVVNGDYSKIIERAKERNPDLKVMISLGGGGLSKSELTLWRRQMTPEMLPDFAHRIVLFVRQNNLDGVDIDLEWSNVTEEYPDFIKIAGDSLHANQYEFSAAFPAMKKYSVLENEDFKIFDFINIMAYDNAGPWQPSVVRQHSSVELAENALRFWHLECQIPKNKLNLGIPCYGYDFGNRPVRGRSFASIITENVELAFDDQDQKLYYNSIPTIVHKTQLALESSGGIMIWELGQDAMAEQGDLSLLHYVYRTVIDKENLSFFPRLSKFTLNQPNENLLRINITGIINEGAYFVLSDIIGCTNEIYTFSPYSNLVEIDMRMFRRGIYTLTLIEPGYKPLTKKVIKINT